MKKLFLLLGFYALCWSVAPAQVPSGSVAPNFTGTDLNGNTYTLYDLLEEGKTVYIDLFATWCPPCWSYANSGAMATIYNTYGPNGSNEAVVLAIEGDVSTNIECLYGLSGCDGGTEGDYVTGTPYPIIEDNGSINAVYGIGGFPVIYMICPADKIAWMPGTLSANELWNFRTSHCASSPLSTSVNTVRNVKCFGTNTGSIDIDVGGGLTPYTYNWSNGLHTQDLNNLPAGVYSCTVTAASAATNILGPITVENPPAPLSVTLLESLPAGCHGMGGSLSISATNGWGNYSYHWNTGQTDPLVTGLSAGSYTVTVTDDLLCTKTFSAAVANPTYPTVLMASPGIITCANPTTQIDATASSSGANFSYHWEASNGGIITNGDTTLLVTVAAGGDYTLQIINSENTCETFGSKSVTANLTAPTANAGPPAAISCVQPNTILQGSGSSGANFMYLWSASNGGNISSGASTLTPTVNAAGTYTLKVTNTTSGCTKTATTTVTGSNPLGLTTTGDTISCFVDTVILNTTTNAIAPVFAWTGPNGYTSALQSPVVIVAGDYYLVVTDTFNGCTAKDTAVVIPNNTKPLAAIATPGNLNCNTSQLQLNGTGSSQGLNFSYLWTTTNGHIISGADTQTPLVDQAGSYNLLVSDSINGCTAMASTHVIQNQAIAINTTQTNISCNGLANGTASVTPSGGNGLYTFVWSNGATTQSISNLDAGTYIAVISDTENCSATASVSIGQPDVLVANATATAQSANGINDGTATVAPSGGTIPYSFLWNNNDTIPTIQNLMPGTYTVTVEDASGCSAVQVVTVNVFNCTLSATISAMNITCFGANNGAAAVSLNGAANPVTYVWSNGETSASVSNLAPGAYSVHIVDGNNCPAELNVIISEPTLLLANTIAYPETAAGANDGAASANPVGGSGMFSYEWSNNDSTQTITGLAPGAYTVIVSDQNGCTALQTVVVNAFNCTISAQPSILNVSCAGASNGAVTIAPTGAAPFIYVWSNGANTATITNLSGGSYTATITDANGCQLVAMAEVMEPMPFSPWTLQTSNPLCPGDPSGTASATISGGTPPYSYLWSNEVSSNTATSLVAGIYTVSVTDQNGCQSTTSVTLNATDNEAPLITCPSNITVCAYDNIVLYDAPVVVDNCPDPSGDHLKLEAGLASGSEFPVGVTTQTYSCSDASGNTSYCTFEVIITPPVVFENPVVSNDVNGQGLGTIWMEVSGGNAPLSYTWTRENQIVGTTPYLNNLTAGIYMLVVTDDSGCSYFGGDFVVGNTTTDLKEPGWLNGLRLQPNPTSGITSIVFAQVPASSLKISVIDATGRVVLTQESEPQNIITLNVSKLPQGMYTLRFCAGIEMGVRKLVIYR